MGDNNHGNNGIVGSEADHEAGDDNKRTATLNYNEEERKLRALAGQWNTPPLPIYASAALARHPPHVTINSNDNTGSMSAPSNLPDSSEEYAKALQEAYRKGAEAAARMAQQQIPSAASCPNFSTGSSQQHQQQHGSSTSSGANNRIATVDETVINAFPMNHQIHPPPHHQMNISIPDPLSSSMPPPLPPSVATSAVQHQHHPPQTQITYAPQHLAEQQPFLQPQRSQQQQQQYPVTTLQQQPQMVVNSMSQPLVASSGAPRHPRPIKAAGSKQSKPQPQQQQQPGRSLSMPDMSAYAAEAEEEKRLKRLARNRASARLRRLRKKNLVDAYETEVGILEKTLKQLEAHEWGNDTDDHKSLLDALGMERGQQAISPEERNTIIQDILKQQKQQVNLLQQAQCEQEVLAMLASGASTERGENSEEDITMLSELQEILQLSEDQKVKLQESSKGLDREVEALETVSASLEAMQKNDWLLNEGVQKITDQFTSILHKNQQSKLLLWTDANAEAVDQLDLVQVQPLQSAPMFSFGVESTTPADDD